MTIFSIFHYKSEWKIKTFSNFIYWRYKSEKRNAPIFSITFRVTNILFDVVDITLSYDKTSIKSAKNPVKKFEYVTDKHAGQKSRQR